MSTRSRIAIVTPSGYLSAYCHRDGYPSGVGRDLLEHYHDDDKVKQLIDLGSLSSVGPEIGGPGPQDFDDYELRKHQCYAYMRDRLDVDGCKPAKHRSFKSLVKLARDSDGEYLYLWTGDRWLVAPVPPYGPLLTIGDMVKLRKRPVRSNKSAPLKTKKKVDHGSRRNVLLRGPNRPGSRGTANHV